MKQSVLEVQPFSEHTQVLRHMGKTGVQCHRLAMPANHGIHGPSSPHSQTAPLQPVGLPTTSLSRDAPKPRKEPQQQNTDPQT